MNDLFGNVVAIIAILSTIALPVGLGMYLAIRSANQKHVERMEMLKQGLMPPSDEKELTNRLKTLRTAILLICVGVGVGVGVTLVKILNLTEDEGFWVIAPLVLLFVGIAHLVYFSLSKKEIENKED